MVLIICVSLVIASSVVSSAPIDGTLLSYVAISPLPENIYNQVQDTKSGEYAFGYAGGPVAREESKTSDGVTRGAYSYVDAYGIVQYYRYVADDNGFRIVGTNIPGEFAADPELQAEQQRQQDEAVERKAIDASDSPDRSIEIPQSRKKRSAIDGRVIRKNDVELPAVVSVVLAAASVPTATSSQSRVQIHKNSHVEIDDSTRTLSSEAVARDAETPAVIKHPIEVGASESTVISGRTHNQYHHSENTELKDESVETSHTEIPAAVPIVITSATAIPPGIVLPIATSSQSRHQTHNNLEQKLHEPVEALKIKTTSAIPEASNAAPVAPNSIEAAPTSASSQSPHQLHTDAKEELRGPLEPIPMKTLAYVPETPVAARVPAERTETIPAEITTPVPISTSGQPDNQFHSNEKAKVHKPVEAFPVKNFPAVPETPVAAPVETTPAVITASVPISTSSQSHYQVHDNKIVKAHEPPHAIPINALIAAHPGIPTAVPAVSLGKSQFQTSNNVIYELGGLPRPKEYGFVELRPTIDLQPLNSFSVASLARHRIGVGLGVVPSPVVAYQNYPSPLFI